MKGQGGEGKGQDSRQYFGILPFAKLKHLEEPRGVAGGIHEGGEELGSAREAVAAGAVGQCPPDGPVGDGADQAVQHVLDQDVHGIL